MNNSSIEIWEKIRIKSAKSFIPIHGHFELTPLCNLNCKMCYIHLLDSQIKEMPIISQEQWMFMVK